MSYEFCDLSRLNLTDLNRFHDLFDELDKRLTDMEERLSTTTTWAEEEHTWLTAKLKELARSVKYEH